MLKENLFIAENQGLDVDEQKKNDILSFIKSCNNFQDFIKKLEEENLIWYFIGPLCKDEDIKEQINLKWKNEFQKFEQSINATHKKFEESLPGENFLVYTIKDNDFQIRFENKEKPIEISALLRASDEGKVYNLSLGKDSQITATKKGSERHYDFTGSSSCEMTINWQAKDSKGNSVDCSMTVEVSSRGIERVIGKPKFGDLIFKDLESEETKKKILELVEQNTEVFINGKTLHQAFTDMGKSVNEQQTPTEETFIKDSPQSPILSSSGYSSPDSRRSSFSGVSEFSDEEDEMLENSMSDDEKEYEQEGSENGVDEIIDGIEELKEEKETFAQYFAKQAKQLEDLKSERNSLKKEVNEQQQAIFERDQKIKEQDAYIKSLTEKLKKSEELNQNIEKEGDTGIRTLSEEKQILEGEVKRLKAELKRKEKELAEKDQDIKKLELEVNVLKQSEKDKNARITDLINQLKDKENEIQSTNRINEELQKKLDQGETELSKLKEENTELINITKRILETDNNEKLLVEKLKEKIDNLVKELNEVNIKNKDLEGELERKNEDLERKIRQLEPGRSLADEMGEVNMKVAKSTQTEIEYKSRGIQSSDHETTVPKTQDQGTQAKNAGVDASSSTDQKEITEMETQTDVKMSDFRDLYDEQGKYVKTELSDPKLTPAEIPEKSIP